MCQPLLRNALVGLVWTLALPACGTITTPEAAPAADTAEQPDTVDPVDSSDTGDPGADTAEDPDAADAVDTAPGTPLPPTLGPQLDRAGRPWVKELLLHAFDSDAVTRDAARDAWNQNGDPATWSAYAPDLVHGLAVLDGIDTVCGNQLIANTSQEGPLRYTTLATVLADDRLVIDTAAPSCSAYLAVELAAIGVPNSECGGRRLNVDVVDATYSMIVLGTLDGSLGDQVGAPAEAQGTAFPYLTEPL